MKVLRVEYKKERFSINQQLSVFEGDIGKDRKYYKKQYNTVVKYFKLGKEIGNSLNPKTVRKD